MEGKAIPVHEGVPGGNSFQLAWEGTAPNSEVLTRPKGDFGEQRWLGTWARGEVEPRQEGAGPKPAIDLLSLGNRNMKSI